MDKLAMDRLANQNPSIRQSRLVELANKFSEDVYYGLIATTSITRPVAAFAAVCAADKAVQTLILVLREHGVEVTE